LNRTNVNNVDDERCSEKEWWIPLGMYLVKVEDKIEFANVAKEGIKNFDKEVDRLQIRKFVIVGIDTQAKEKSGVSTIDDLEVTEL
jgi:hypothetical protein